MPDDPQNSTETVASRPWPFLRLLWLLPVMWAGLIFYLSSLPLRSDDFGPDFPFKDKIGHLGLYGILGGLLALTLSRAHQMPLVKTTTLAILIASLYGISDETHQIFVPGRMFDLVDWLADTVGATLAAIAIYHYESRRSAKKNH